MSKPTKTSAELVSMIRSEMLDFPGCPQTMQVLRRTDEELAAGYDDGRHARPLAEGRGGNNGMFLASGKHDQRASFAETVDLAVRPRG